ncbi:type II secretion system F family protein [Microbacterium sp. cf332]|uniref:type II secretion system F family protein n=1 Tax=Microbacterium sp. cf332 TaxID=1761804 RepID=UPI00087E0FE8|nr:type II secretion system F family protein [Microbacterium sp. cf332]SDQ13562.1 tight adherence protein C [Microbacterium sp. cf332]
MSAVSDLASAVLLGICLAGGLVVMASAVPRWTAPPLERRIAPYLRDVADPLGLTPLRPALRVPVRGRRAWADWLERASDSAALGGLIVRAGWTMTPAAFRARQVLAGIAGLVVGVVLAVAGSVASATSPAVALVPGVSAAGGVVLAHLTLVRAADRRMRRIREEVPTVLEFLALCLSAGESLTDALRRVGDVGAGELTAHLRAAVLAAGTGSSLADALRDMARSLGVGSIDRAVDHLVSAIERGAPLAQVLQSQAADAREDAKRVLIEQAGRKEILMLLPLVFLVLPLSVLFAVFPGIVMLRLGV